MIKIFFNLIIFLIFFFNNHSTKADMNDPLESRINSDIISKIFPQANYIDDPQGDPPFISVYGSAETNLIDEQILHRWRQEFLQINAREPTELETKEKISSLQIKGSQKKIGYLFSTYETTKAKGYSGDYFDIIVGVSTEGRLKGSVILELHEPMICPTCVPQSELESLHEAFINTDVNRRVDLNSGTGGGRGYDGVAGATISATLTTNGMITGARKIMRMTGSFRENQEPFYLEVDQYVNRSWDELLLWGGISGINLSKREVSNKLGNDENLTISNPDKNFISIYFGLANPASVGRNIFGDKWYSHHVSQVGTGDNLLVIMGSGQWSWKKNTYQDSSQQVGDSNHYSRISVLQNNKVFNFTGKDILSSTAVRAKGRPKISEIGLLRIPKEWGFNPLEQWTLELKINEKNIGRGSIFLDYNLPNELISGDLVKLENAGFRPISTAFFGTVRQSNLSEWQIEWANQDNSIVFLLCLLFALTIIFIKQKELTSRRIMYLSIRSTFLLVTLFWLGWISQSQLSIINLISYAQAIFSGKGFNQFLYEPLLTIIAIYTFLSLLFLGRGVFCGWLCPFGALQELLFKASRYFKIPQLQIPFWLNKQLWLIKYFILASLILCIFIGNDFSYKLLEIEPFKTSITSYFLRSTPYVLYASVLLIIGIFSERFFCRFICPLGAALALLGKFHLLNLIPRRPECGNPCHLCERSCPVQAIDTTGKINMNECFQCLDCEIEYFDDKRCPPLVHQKSLKSIKA